MNDGKVIWEMDFTMVEKEDVSLSGVIKDIWPQIYPTGKFIGYESGNILVKNFNLSCSWIISPGPKLKGGITLYQSLSNINRNTKIKDLLSHGL